MLKDKLVALRNRANISKKDVADKIGVRYQTYLKYESGKTLPDFITSKAIADLYDVSVDFLMDRGIYEDSMYSKSLEKTFLQNTKELFSSTDHKVRNAFEKYYYNRGIDKLIVVDYEVIDYNWFTRGQEYIVIKQNNNDMEPRINKGDNVIVKLQDKFANSDMVLIQFDNEPAIIRTITRKNDVIVLFALNTGIREKQVQVITEDDNFKIIGVVIEIRSRVGRI